MVSENIFQCGKFLLDNVLRKFKLEGFWRKHKKGQENKKTKLFEQLMNTSNPSPVALDAFFYEPSASIEGKNSTKLYNNHPTMILNDGDSARKYELLMEHLACYLLNETGTLTYSENIGGVDISDLEERLTQLEQENKEYAKKIEELEEQEKKASSPKEEDRLCHVYRFYRGNETIYIGKDKSQKQDRVQEHMTEARKIRCANHQSIDLHLACHPDDYYSIEKIPVKHSETDELEQKLIEEFNPLFNFTHARKESMVCEKCGKEYKILKSYNIHIKKCGSELDKEISEITLDDNVEVVDENGDTTMFSFEDYRFNNSENSDKDVNNGCPDLEEYSFKISVVK